VSVVRRGARLAIVGGLVSIAACTCPDPITLDQVFLLDATPSDGGLAGAASDSEPSLDCTATAAGCVAGGSCRPACDCVLARDRVSTLAIKSCTLLAGAGPAVVEVRYEQAVFCGGD